MQEINPCSRHGTSKLDYSLLLIIWTKKKPGGKICGNLTQKLSCLATMRSNLFGGEKARPLTPRTPDLLSGMELVV